MSNGITKIKFLNGKIVKATRFTRENTNNILVSIRLSLMYKDLRGTYGLVEIQTLVYLDSNLAKSLESSPNKSIQKNRRKQK
ncbi:MAG: hypothetical protein CM15mP32_2810 [Flavobacteriaceae bacterium]|nr:MAG: hypothetical protein CM15mP32_2810 [Flavobacteriaceae bacterium]